MDRITEESISCMRIISCESINNANSGHPGIALGIAPMVYTIFTKHLRVNPKLEKWQDRDRFILSAGHGSSLLYTTLHLSGFEISLDQIKKFREIDSITPGHPESTLTPGVEAATGPLGQGIGVGVGCALAETIHAKKYNKPDCKIVDHYTYLVTSDGDLQEGVSYEAISLAGHWKLNKLIVLFDSNDIQLDGKVSVCQSENMKKRFESANWNYILVKNGNSVAEIDAAINSAKKCKDKPTIIEVKTIIGYGATKQGTAAVHGAPVGADIENIKQKFKWNERHLFNIPNRVYKDFQIKVQDRGIAVYYKWIDKLKKYQQKYPDLHKEFLNVINNKINIDYKDFFRFIPKGDQATRVSSGFIMDELTKNLPNLVGGSADLSSSTKIVGADGTYEFNNRSGRNIAYGVREFAMATINNGLACHGGIIPFASGFFVFSDYMKPAIRLASLMKLQSLFILTHDSILLGQDGPTHQPIEQLAMFRAQPNINVFRPADFKETLGCYFYALNKSKRTPSMIVLSRQNVIQLSETNYNKICKGAYFISKDLGAKITLIATGSEVSLAIKVKKELSKTGIKTNVVSMPCQELFDKQSQEYQNKILLRNTKIISLELGTTFGWAKYTGINGLNIGIDTFGASGSEEQIIKKYKLSPTDIANKIIKFLKSK